MAEVVWSAPALSSLSEITAYITAFSPLAAQRMALRLRVAGDSLSAQPLRGRAGRGGRRELVTVRPYIITYLVTEGVVEIIDIRHGARQPD